MHIKGQAMCMYYVLYEVYTDHVLTDVHLKNNNNKFEHFKLYAVGSFQSQLQWFVFKIVSCAEETHNLHTQPAVVNTGLQITLQYVL